jgi:hypothetical protein
MKKPSIAGSYPVTPKDAAATKEMLEIVTARRAGVPKLDIAGLESLTIGGAEKRVALNAVAAGSAVTFDGLDGDSDELYEVIVRGSFSGSVSGTGLFLQPNGDTAPNFLNGQHRGYFDGTNWQHDVTNLGGSAGFFAGWDDFGLAGAILSRTLIWSKTGQRRVAHGQTSFIVAGANQFLTYVTAGFWTNTTANINSINLAVTVGGSFTGTAELRKPLKAPTQAQVEFLRLQLARLARRLDE